MEEIIETRPNEKDLKDIKITYEYSLKFNDNNYLIMIGILKDFLVLKVINKSLIKDNYISFFTFEQLKEISKSMRYFDDINDIISFLENKGNKNELFLKKEKDKIFIEFKLVSPSGKEELILLELKPTEISDKELIKLLLKKVDNLEKQIIVLNKEILKVNDLEKLLEKEISKVNDLEKQIKFLNKEIEKLKIDSDEEDEEFESDNENSNNNEIKFNNNYLKEAEILKKTKPPKRPISAFFFYCKERREKLKKEFPNLDNKEIIKNMSIEWNCLSDEIKKPYWEKAFANRKRYEDEKKAYDMINKYLS